MARLKKVNITYDSIAAIVKFICNNITDDMKFSFLTNDVENNSIVMYFFHPEFEENNESVVDIIESHGRNVEEIDSMLDMESVEIVNTIIEQSEKIKKTLLKEKFGKILN